VHHRESRRRLKTSKLPEGAHRPLSASFRARSASGSRSCGLSRLCRSRTLVLLLRPPRAPAGPRAVAPRCGAPCAAACVVPDGLLATSIGAFEAFFDEPPSGRPVDAVLAGKDRVAVAAGNSLGDRFAKRISKCPHEIPVRMPLVAPHQRMRTLLRTAFVIAASSITQSSLYIPRSTAGPLTAVLPASSIFFVKPFFPTTDLSCPLVD
jgi:hypothetical protein